MGFVVALLVVIAAGALWIAVTPSPPASAKAAYVIGQFNMAGGNEAFGTKISEPPEALLQDVLTRRPLFITIQEGCQDWITNLDQRLGQYSAAFDQVRVSKFGRIARCQHPTDFGNAVLYRDDLGIDQPLEAFDLGTGDEPAAAPELEQREMVCVKSNRRKLAVCSAHLTNRREDVRRDEARLAHEIMGAMYKGYTIFFGGDLNDIPTSAVARTFYGDFKEVDGTNTRTMGRRKIDYLFVPKDVQVDSAEVTDNGHSDHRILWSGILL